MDQIDSINEALNEHSTKREIKRLKRQFNMLVNNSELTYDECIDYFIKGDE